MAGHEAYLRSALSRYTYADQTKREVLSVLQTFTDLRPAIQKYVFNDGIGKDLLCLEGTIQVVYKGKTYNIPICLWLMDTHPYNPPLVYVKPTANMQIKPGRHVDNTGRIYLPYLHEWKHPQSDIMGLLQILAMVFGDEPPVFAKPQGSTPSSYPNTSSTPYPPTGAQMPMPGAYPPSTSPYMPYPPTTGTTAPYYPGYPATGGASRPPYGGGPSYPPPGNNFYPPATAASQQNSLSDEQIRLSLMTAVEDKMKRRLREITSQSHAEVETLKRTEEDLQRGRQKLDDMLQRIEREQNEVERNIRLLREKDDELKDALARLDVKDQLSIDEAVQPTAPLYKQLLKAFAEEQATEDAVYYMGEALRKGVIELDAFLKQVRELSRKQFMLRMLIHKCRQKAGLPDISG